MRLAKVLAIIYAVILALTWVCTCLVRLVLHNVYSDRQEFEIFCSVYILGFICIILSRAIYIHRRSICSHLRAYINKIFTSHRQFLYSRTIFTLVVNVALIVLISNSLSDLQWYGIKAIAYALDAAGKYELGEQVYSCLSNRTQSSLATVGTGFGHDANLIELKNERLNKAVSKIYGTRSIQLANRYRILAFHYIRNFDDWQTAETYFRKSLEIYKLYAYPEERISIYSYLALHQYETGAINTMKSTIAEAIPDIQKSRQLDSSVPVSIQYLYGLSKKTGDLKLMNLLLLEKKRLTVDDHRNVNGFLSLSTVG